MRRPKNPTPRAGCEPDQLCCPTLTANPDGSFTFNRGDGSAPVIIPAPAPGCCPTLVDNGGGTYTFDRGDGSAPVIFNTTTDHPAAQLTHTAAPFSWNAATQTGNIPQTPSLVQNANGSFTFNSGDGTATVTIPPDCCPTLTPNPDGSFTFDMGDGSPVVTIPALPVDVYLSSGYYDSTSQEILLTLSNGSVINIPVSALLPVLTDGVTVVGDGAATPLQAGQLIANPDGSFTWSGANGSTFAIPADCCPQLTAVGLGTFTYDQGDGSPPIAINAQPPTLAFAGGDLTITANGATSTVPLRGPLLQDLAGVDLGYLLPLT